MTAIARRGPRSELPERLRAKVGRAITAWFSHLSPPSRSLYRRGLVHFAEWLRGQEAIELDETPDPRAPERSAWEDVACTRAGQYLLGFPFYEGVHLVEAYLADCLFEKPQLSRATVQSRLAALRWAVREARRQNLVDWDLQTARVPRPLKNKQGRLVERDGRDMRGPEPHEKQALLQAAHQIADARIGITMAMFLNEGYREHEIRQLDFEDLDLRKQVVMMVRKKRGRPEAYPMSASTMIAVRRWIELRGEHKGPLLCGGKYPKLTPHKRVGQKTLFRWVRRCCSAAQLSYSSPHRLRHRACTDIVDVGVKMGIAEERILFLTGHSNRSALRPYYEASKDTQPLRDLLDAASGTATARKRRGDR